MPTGFPVKPLETVDVAWHNAVGGFRIADQQVGGTSTVTLSSISQNFKHLLLLFRMSTTGTATDAVALRVNGVSTANYHVQQMQGLAAGATAAETLLGTSATVAFTPGSTGRTDAHYGSSGVIVFPAYSLTGSFPTWVCRSDFTQTAVTAGSRAWIYGGALQSAAQAISSITLLSAGSINWVTGSRVTLYGLT